MFVFRSFFWSFLSFGIGASPGSPCQRVLKVAMTPGMKLVSVSPLSAEAVGRFYLACHLPLATDGGFLDDAPAATTPLGHFPRASSL